jgi:hypothetical protein
MQHSPRAFIQLRAGIPAQEKANVGDYWRCATGVVAFGIFGVPCGERLDPHFGRGRHCYVHSSLLHGETGNGLIRFWCEPPPLPLFVVTAINEVQNQGGIMTKFLVGLGFGIGMGMLFAPMRGEDMRVMATVKASEIADTAREAYGQVQGKVQKVVTSMTGAQSDSLEAA